MAGFRNSTKNDGMGSIQIDQTNFKRFEKAWAKQAGKSPGMRLESSAIFGNVVTGALFVEDTNDSRIYISDAGDEPSKLGTIPNVGINPKYIIFGQPIKIRKTDSGGYEYIGLDTERAAVFNEGSTNTIDQNPVSQSQLDWASLKPYQGLVATVKGAIYGDIAVPDLATADFSASPLDTASNPIDIPSTANRAIGILVQLNPSTAALSYKQSAEFNAAIGLMEAYRAGLLPLRDTGKLRVGYLKLANGAAQFDNSTVMSWPEWFPSVSPVSGDNDGSTDNALVRWDSVSGKVIQNSAAILDDSDNLTALNSLAFKASTELTIASGAVTITAAVHRIDTQSNDPSDDLDTINGGTTNRLLLIRPEDGARTVVVRHNGGGTGNIRTPNGSDVELDETYKALLLLYDGSDSLWKVVGGAGGSIDIDGLPAWDNPPDEGIVFIAQEIGTSDYWKLTGDEMRQWLASTPSVSFSTSSRAMQSYAINSATDRTITINSSTVVIGHWLRVQAVQVSGGTGHKVLLPAGVYFGHTGTDRAALFDAVGDYLDAQCFNIGGTLRFLVFGNNGVTFAAS